MIPITCAYVYYPAEKNSLDYKKSVACMLLLPTISTGSSTSVGIATVKLPGMICHYVSCISKEAVRCLINDSLPEQLGV